MILVGESLDNGVLIVSFFLGVLQARNRYQKGLVNLPLMSNNLEGLISVR